MNKKELKKAFEEGLISEEKYKEELFAFETAPKQPRKAKRIKESPSEEEVAKLLKTFKSQAHKVYCALATDAGPRISEICNLKREDIDLERKRIFIRQGKGGKDRIIPLPKWFRQKHLSFFPPKIKQRALEAAFQRNSIKAGINPIVGHFQRAGKEIPVYKYTFHSLRHFFATRALEKGIPISHIQILLGHENLATTSRYTVANPVNALRSIMEADL